MSVRVVRWLASAACVAAACLPDLVQEQGEHLLHEHSPTLEICGGNVEYLDAIVPFFSEHLGIRTPEQIRYSWITRADRDRLIGVKIPDQVEGISIGFHATSWSEPALVHEIFHSMVGPNSANSFFREGFATACAAVAAGWYLPYDDGWYQDPRELMFLASRDLDYASAGVFVMFLIARHGPEKFFRLYFGVHAPIGPAKLERMFGEIYGYGLHSEVEHFVRGDLACDDYGFDLLAARCTAPTSPWSGDVWSFAGVLACDSSGVVGGVSPTEVFPSFTVASVLVPTSGTYTFELYGDAEVTAEIAQCFGCSRGSVFDGLDATQPVVTLELAEGRYQVRVSGRSDAAPTFGVVLRPAPPTDP